MSAGWNLRVEITQQGYEDDDVIGGAIYTGTVIQTLPARMQPLSRSLLTLEQGLEGAANFSVELPSRARVTENDHIKLVYPQSHRYYNQRFLVTDVQATSMHPKDSRGYTRIVVRRVERGRNQV